MKFTLKNFLQITIPLVIFLFFISRIKQNWSQISQYQFSANPFLFIVSLMLLIGTILFSGWIWKKILESTTFKKIDNFDALNIYIYTWFFRYFPGKVGVVLGKVYLGNKILGIPKKKLFLASVYEYTFLILSSFLLGWYALYQTRTYSGLYLALILASLTIFFIFLIILPKFFYIIFNTLLTLLKKKELASSKKLSSFKILFLLFLYFLNRILMGAAFLFLLKSFIFIKAEDYIFIISSFILASIIGLLAIFTPSGLGVKEGILVFLLQNIIPTDIAIIVSLLARIWLTLADALLVLLLIPKKLYEKI